MGEGEKLPAHSPLGASGAGRWIPCPGSVGLGAGIVSESSEHAELGTAAHELAEECLREDKEPWTFYNTTIMDHLVDKEMVISVSTWTNSLHKAHPGWRKQEHFIEHKFHCPSIHHLFFGTADFALLDREERTLYVRDYKHGIGVVVEVENNKQVMYYGCGVLESIDGWKDYDWVVFTIVQPRAPHKDGPVRTWRIKVTDLAAWLEDELVPAMYRAETSTVLKPGPWCRFCPVLDHKCPKLEQKMLELRRLDRRLSRKPAPEITDEELGEFLDLFELLKMRNSALGKLAFGRLSTGRRKIPGRKLVYGVSHRVWKDPKRAEAEAVAALGDRAYSKPTLLSPPQMEKVPGGKEVVKSHAFKPKGSLSMARSDDPKAEVSADTKAGFTPVERRRK